MVARLLLKAVCTTVGQPQSLPSGEGEMYQGQVAYFKVHHKKEDAARRKLFTICSGVFTAKSPGASRLDLTSIKTPKGVAESSITNIKEPEHSIFKWKMFQRANYPEA